MSAAAITNETFLEAMFEDAAPGTHTVVCSFSGDPLSEDRFKWAGRPWRPGERLPRGFALERNTYLTVSSFEPDPATGERRRRKACFHAMHAVMVDDLGTKVANAMLRLPPSALLETSPDNYQAFLFLVQDEAARNRALCARLIDRMIAGGLTADGADPGMRGVTRYGRLPEGVNAKAKYVERLGRPFPVCCVEFDPSRRYRVAEIAAAWRLDLSAPPARTPRPVPPEYLAGAPVRFAALLALLEALGLYKGRGAGAWHEITCPWLAEHSDRADSGTAIAEPSEANAWRGGFHCHHGHCEGRHLRDLARELGRLIQTRAAS